MFYWNSIGTESKELFQVTNNCFELILELVYSKMRFRNSSGFSYISAIYQIGLEINGSHLLMRYIGFLEFMALMLDINHDLEKICECAL